MFCAVDETEREVDAFPFACTRWTSRHNIMQKLKLSPVSMSTRARAEGTEIQYLRQRPGVLLYSDVAEQ